MTRTPFTALPLALSLCALGGSVAHAGSPAEVTDSAVIVCRSDAGGPWKAIAKGSLKRTKTDQSVDYHLSVGDHAFRWANKKLSDQSWALTMPNSLVRALVEDPKRPAEKFPRGPVNVFDYTPSNMSLNGNGEIREQLNDVSVAAVLGVACPK